MAKASKVSAADAAEIKCSLEHNPAEFLKASKRFKNIVTEYKEFEQPKAIKAWKVLPSPFNRLGAPLNTMYIHGNLGPNVHTKGYDPERPRPGMVVRRTDPDNIKRLKDHVRNMAATSPTFFPQYQLDSPEACYECIGGNHLTTVIRFYEVGFVSPVNKIRYEVPKDETELAEKVASGHSYIVLREGIPDDDLKFLSEYLNSDQNDNQATSEMSTLSQVSQAVNELLAKSPHPTVSQVVNLVAGRSLLKLRPDTIGDMAHYAINLAGSRHMQELISWHARHVNPKELSVSSRWMGDLAKAFGKGFPIMQNATAFVQYRGEARTEQTRPTPDLSRSVTIVEINNAKKGENLARAEEFCRDTRNLLFAEFENLLGGDSRARSFFNIFEESAARLLYAKSLAKEAYEHNVSGKYTDEKLEKLRAHWLAGLEKDVAELKGICMRFSIRAEDITSNEKGVEEDEACDGFKFPAMAPKLMTDGRNGPHTGSNHGLGHGFMASWPWL